VRQILSVWIVAALVALLAAAGGAAVGSASDAARSSRLPALPKKPMGAVDRVRVSAVVRELLNKEQYKAEIPGLLIGIWSPTQGVYRAGFGQASLTSPASPKPADSFRIGSVSKTFTATVILQLVDEGRLSLTSTVRKVAPALARRHPAIGSRTVAQLLGMRSGLPEYADAAVKVATRNPQRVWTANQLIALGMRSGPVKPAGGRTSVYTNTNYVILGQIAEAVTGTRFDRLVRQRLLVPLGLRDTVYPAPIDTRLPAPFTRGYVGPGGAEEIQKLGGTIEAGADVTRWNPSWGNAAGMMISTIDDLARWANGVSGNALLSPRLQRLRLATTPVNESFRYGLGIMKLLPGGRWVGHEGGIPGWSTWALADPKTGTVVVTSVNACCGGTPAGLTVDILKRLYPETFVTGPPLPGGKPYQLSETTTLTPPSGWTIDPAGTVKGVNLRAVKPGVVFSIGPLPFPEGQTFESWTTVLRDSRVAPGWVVSPLTPFTTTTGLKGATYTTRSAAESSQSWFVTNGAAIVRLDVNGSPSAVRAVAAEMARMARSITMTAP
jgi:D-alanyl-D-alanine carboxypeptidase